MDIGELPHFKDFSSRRIAYVSSALVLAATAFAFVYEIELKQDVAGEIVSRSDMRVEGVDGMVTEIYVAPQARVEAGMPLFRVDRDFSLSADGKQRSVFDQGVRDAQLRDFEKSHLERRAELDARLATLRKSLQTLLSVRQTLEQEALHQNTMVEEAEAKLARLMAAEQFVVADRIEQARLDLAQYQIAAGQSASRRQQLINDIETNRGQQEEVKAQINSLSARHALDTQDIRTRFEHDRKDAVISAPCAGTVSFTNVLPGKVLDKSEVAMIISTGSTAELYASLRIPSRRRGFVKEGQTVRLKLDAYPYTRFGTHPARITSVSRAPVTGAATPLMPAGLESPAAATEGEYVAWAALSDHMFFADGEQREILPGMQATASIVVERRTIAEWVLEPVFKMFRG